MTGSTSATRSTAVGAVELREVATRLGSKNGREGKMAKLTVSATKPLVWPEMDRSDDGVEGDLRRRRARARSLRWSRALRALGARLLDEVDSGGAPGHGETAWGGRRAWLRRGGGGDGVGHGWGVRGGGAGEERGCLGGSGERGRPVHGVSRAREAARRRAAAWRAAVPPPSTLAACLASQAARWSGGRAGPARWAGWWACGGAR